MTDLEVKTELQAAGASSSPVNLALLLGRLVPGGDRALLLFSSERGANALARNSEDWSSLTVIPTAASLPR